MFQSNLPKRLWFFVIGCLFLSACSVLGGPTPEQVKQMRADRNAREAQANMQQHGQQPSSQQASMSDAQQKPQLSQACADRFKSADKMVVRDPSTGQVNYIKVSATGYGAAPKKYFPEPQRRLMTMRAAKVDAYRALAEVVGGLHVWGGSALSEMVLEHDRYRSFVDTYVRGARVIALDEHKDGSFQASVEMQVDAQFLSKVLAFIDPMLAACIDEQDVLRSLEHSQGVVSSVYYSE